MYKSFFYVCFLLPILLAITGCNDSNDDNVHAESSVTIGLIFPLSAPKGKPRHHAALLAAKHLAEAGYPIRTVVEDSKLDKFLGVEAARKLVENGGAKVLIGASDSGITMEIADWVSIPKRIPQISYASTSQAITGLKDEGFLFRTAPSDKLQGAVLAYLAKEEKGYDKVAIIYRQGSYGENLSSIFQEEFEKRCDENGCGTVTSIQSHVAEPPKDFDPTENFNYIKNILDNIFDDGIPQAIVAISRDEESNLYIKQALAREEFKEVKFIFVDANKGTDIFDKGVSKTALNDMCGTLPSPPDYTTSQNDPRLIFEKEYEAKFGPIGSLTYLHHSYDAVIVAGLAAYSATKKKNGAAITPIDIRNQLEEIASTTETESPTEAKIGTGPDNIRKALELLDKGESINYEGASGNVDFDENGDVIAPFEIWCYNNGETLTDKICEVTDIETTPKLVVCKEPTPKPSQQ
jgi:ABC-type branched-subunit amino acid transport system substrate-binding protein